MLTPHIRKISLLILALLTIFLVAAGCSESSSTSNTCQDRVNNRQYEEVAADEDCSTYWRGSAELGLAGFEFSSFIITAALDSFPDALGLNAVDCFTSGTESLDIERSFFSKFQRHYLRSQNWTRWSYTSVGEQQPLFDAEIAMFAAAGEIIAETYCKIDENLDGAMTLAEINSFAALQVPTGSADIVSTDFLLVVQSSQPWLIDTKGSTSDDTSWECQETDNYSSVWDSTTGATATGSTCSALLSDASETSLVAIVNALPRIFQEGTTTSDVDAPFNLLGGALQKGADIFQDLDTIGLMGDSSDSIKDAVTEQMARIDNGGLDGGSCGGGNSVILTSLETLVTLLDNVEHASALADAELITNNLFSLSTLSGLLDTGSTCSSCGSVRLIFAADTATEGSTDLYKEANADIAETLELSAHLMIDTDTGERRTTTAGDFNITFEELLCLS